MQRSKRAETHPGCWRITSMPRKMACPNSSSLPGTAVNRATSVIMLILLFCAYSIIADKPECHTNVQRSLKLVQPISVISVHSYDREGIIMLPQIVPNPPGMSVVVYSSRHHLRGCSPG